MDRNYWQSNSVLYIHSSGVLFFDATWTPSTARQLLWKASVLTSAEFLGVIPTSYDIHRTGGLSYFHDRRVPVIVYRKTLPLYRSRFHAMDEEMKRSFGSWDSLPRSPVSYTFEDRVTLLDGSVEIVYPGAARTEDNLVVYFPRERILYAGSLLSSPLLFQTESNLEGYESVLDYLESLPVDLVVAGHGPPLQKRELLEKVRREARSLLSKRATAPRKE